MSALVEEPGVHVTLVPHLYDMASDHSGMQFLKSVPGTLVVMGWLHERAIRWTLDRADVRGQEGITLLKADDEEIDEDGALDLNGIGSVDLPDRTVYCIDLRVSGETGEFIDEILRIQDERVSDTFDLMSWIQGSPQPEQLQRYLEPERMLVARQATDAGGAAVTDRDILPEDTRRRWYPVIDYSRCTNCMECIDFCLFGVYGVDALDRILVEEQDNCKKGCPACSRVCPEQAIIFPQHKNAAIAGAEGEVTGVKIDLSRLFGGDDGLSSVEQAVKERDAELILDGREAVGMSIGIKERDRDEFDDLLDEFDALEF